MARKKSEFLFEEKMDMTPLIDCVFLLILFFILTTEITMSQEEVELPFALEGKEAQLSVQVDKVVKIEVVRKDPQFDPKKEGLGDVKHEGQVVDFEGVVEIFRKAVLIDMLPPPRGYGREPEILPGPEGRRLSQVKVLIRADKRVRAEYLRTIFMACEKVDPAIYKIEISSEQPSP